MLKKLLIPMCIALVAGTIYCLPTFAKAEDLDKVQDTVSNINKPAPEMYNEVNFETVSYDKALQALTTAVDSCKLSEGFLYYKDNSTGYLYIAVMRGQKPTGGYGIKVSTVKDAQGRTNVLAEEADPHKDAILPQVVTYPYTIIKIKLSDFSLSVKNSSGKVYDYLGQGESKIVGCSWVIGNLENIYTEKDYIFLKVRYVDGEYEFFYVKNNDEWQNKIRNLKVNTTVSIKFALGTPKKYNEMSAFPLSEIESPIDKSSFTDEKWGDLNSEYGLDILRDKEWTIRYNQQIDQSNVNSSNVYATDSSGNIIPTAVSLQDDKKSIKVIPYKPYKLGEKYYLFISSKVNGNNKDSLNGYRMSFQISDSIYIK